MTTLIYQGVAYRQGVLAEAPWLVLFVAPAEELLEWASIPRRSEHNLSGFQRAEDPRRVDKAKEYFETPHNQSPTALIVGIHPVAVGDQSVVELEFLEETPASPVRPCRIQVHLDRIPDDLESATVAIKAQLRNRLGSQAEINIISENTVEDTEDTEDQVGESLVAESAERDEEDSGAIDDAADDADFEADSQGDSEIELGRSIITGLLEQLEDPAWCEAQAAALLDLAKPATIIDGQHRVRGAELCERQIPFAVCAIFDCQWPEQVFQFTVVNYTAKGIPDQFITANAALSLTKGELDELQVRLLQANVKVKEYELMRVVNFDPTSPFVDLVNLSEKRDQERIGYKTMVQVARAWYDARHDVFDLVLENLYPDLKGRRKKGERVRRWKDTGDWGLFFLAFWRRIKAAYETKPSHEEGHNLWQAAHSQLLNAVVLYELQDAFLTNLNAQDEQFFRVTEGAEPLADLLGKVERRAETFASYVPPDFFAEKWKLTSLNVGPGRKALQEVFRGLVDKKGNYQFRRSAIVTGDVG